MRLGLTTGTCFIAAAKAALYSLLNNRPCSSIIVELPIGLRVEVPIADIELGPDHATACVVKDAGDNAPFDVTHGVKICVEARVAEGNGQVRIIPGPGVGINKDTGEPAISKRVIEYLIKNLEEVTNLKNVDIILKVWIPNGEKIAEKTLNKLFNIVGGLSLLGEKGIEIPTGNPYYSPQIEHIKTLIEHYAHTSSAICLVTGGRSLRFAEKTLRDVPVVDVGDHVGYALRLCIEKSFKNIVIITGPAKAVKLSGGIYMLHHDYADARIEILTSKLLEFMIENFGDVDVELLKGVLKCETVEKALNMLDGDLCRSFLRWLSNKIEHRIRRDFDLDSSSVNVCICIIYNEEPYLSTSCRGCIQC